jgi:nucleoside-diphosphate-sugar epimerase
MDDAAHRTLVTGANGFIGRRLVRRLLAACEPVTALVLPGEEVPSSWGSTVRVVRGSIEREDDVRSACEGATRIHHLAAVVGDHGSWPTHERITVGGTRNVIESASQTGARLVLASSICVYGNAIARGECSEDTPWGAPQSHYERAKQEQERLAWAAHREGRLRLSVVRPANVFGAGSGPWHIKLIEVLRNGQPSLIGGGLGNAGLVYVENLVDILLLAGNEPAAEGLAFNACDGADVTWKQYLTDLGQRAGASKPPKPLNRTLAFALAYFFEAAWIVLGREDRPPITRGAINLVGSDCRFNTDRLASILGYHPRISYDQAMREIAQSL